MIILPGFKRNRKMMCPRDHGPGHHQPMLDSSNPLCYEMLQFMVGGNYSQAIGNPDTAAGACSWSYFRPDTPPDDMGAGSWIRSTSATGSGHGGQFGYPGAASADNYCTLMMGFVPYTSEDYSYIWYVRQSSSQYARLELSNGEPYVYYHGGSDYGYVAPDGTPTLTGGQYYTYGAVIPLASYASDGQLYIDGAEWDSYTAACTKPVTITASGVMTTCYILRDEASTFYNGYFAWGAAWNRKLDAEEFWMMNENPYRVLWNPSGIAYSFPSIGPNYYSLSCAGSTYAWSPLQEGVGSTAQRKLPLAGSSYATTGTAATEVATRKMPAAGSSYAVTGGAAVGAATRVLTLAGSSYEVTGSAISSVFARQLAAAGSSYAVTGAALTAAAQRKLDLGGSTYAITGAAMAPTATRLLSLAGSSYAVTGGGVDFERACKITAEGGTYTITGAAVTLVKSGTMAYYLDLAGGTYAIVGGATTLARALQLVAAGGTYVITGTAAGVVVARKLPLAGSTYSVTGAAQTYKRELKIPAGGGTYTVTGAEIVGAAARKLAAAGSSYSVTGSSDTLARGLALIATSGTYALTGGAQTYTYIRHITFLMAGGVYSVTGVIAAMAYGFSGEERRWDITLYYPPGTIIATGRVDSSLVPREKVTDTRDYDFDYCADPLTLPVPLINYDVGYSSIRQPVILRGFLNDPITIETVPGRPLCLTRRGIATTAMRMLGAKDVWLELRKDLTFDMVKADGTEIQGTYTVGGSYPAP